MKQFTLLSESQVTTSTLSAGLGNQQRLDFLDQFRGVAILLVFLFHCFGAAFGSWELHWHGWFHDFTDGSAMLVLAPLSYGWTGVAIFFVVSGICIHLAHQRSSRQDWATFFTRRFFRIYPPYLVAVLLFSFTRFVYPAFPAPGQPAVLPLGWIVKQLSSHLFLVHNFNDSTVYGINIVFWSLAVEFQLYLLYPLLLLLVRKFSWTTLLFALFGLELAQRTIASVCLMTGHSLPGWFAFTPFYFWFSWALGAAVGDSFLNRREFGMGRNSAIFYAILLVVVFFVKPLAPFAFMLAALVTASLVGALLNSSWAKAVSRTRPLGIIGLSSYSLYLVHEPMVNFTKHVVVHLVHGHPLPPVAMFAFCVLAFFPIMIFAWLLYRSVELPAIAMGKRFINRWLEPHPDAA